MNQVKTGREEIGEGIFANFVENDRFKTNYVTFYFVMPLTAYNASAGTLLSRVLLRGCEKYPTQREMNRVLDHAFDAALDSDTERVGEWHAVSLQLTMLDDAFSFGGEDITSEGMDLLEEALMRPYLPNGAFDPDYVESERSLALDELAARINNKARYARSRMFEHMCRLEPYSVCPQGDRRNLKLLTPEALTEYYRTLLRESRMEIFFVGRFDREACTARLKRMFAHLERKVKPLPEISVRIKPRSVREVTERMDIRQANLVMGFRTACTVQDKASAAFSVYNGVLGGSLTSKLFCHLREKMSLCYSVASIPDLLKGVMLIYAGIAPENRDVAIREAMGQMDEICRGNISDEELESARNALLNALRGLEDNPAALAEWYLPRVLTGRFETPYDVIARLERVTREDVVAVSKNVRLDTVYTLTAKEA